MPAKQARGRSSSRANQMSPPSALLNSLGVERHHAAVLDAGPTRQCALHVADVGRAAVGLHPEQLFEVNRLAQPVSQRFLVASIRACCDDGIPPARSGLAALSSRCARSDRIVRNTLGIGARLPTYRLTTRNSAMMAASWWCSSPGKSVLSHKSPP
jgi:hypothetical protein